MAQDSSTQRPTQRPMHGPMGGPPGMLRGGEKARDFKGTMTKLLRDDGFATVTVHGFRSTFRDWAAETTAYPSEVVEMALAHTIGNKAEAAYRRGDLFEKRGRLMEDWSRYCGTSSAKPGAVVPMRKSKSAA